MVARHAGRRLASIRETLTRILYSASGSAPPEHRWRFLFRPDETLLDTVVRPERLPAWLDVGHLDFLVAEFTRTGFRGGLNYYRNLDFNWTPEEAPAAVNDLLRAFLKRPEVQG